MTVPVEALLTKPDLPHILGSQGRGRMGFSGITRKNLVAQRSGASVNWKRLASAALFCALLVWPSLARAHGDVHEQIVALSAQIQANPTQAELYLRRGELHRVHEDWDAAYADFDQALLLDPKLGMVDFLRGRLFLDAGWPRSAEASVDRALKRQPKHTEALLVRARARARLGRGEEAAADYTKAIGLLEQPGPELFIERARILTDIGTNHWAGALSGLEEGIQKLGPLVTLELYAVDIEVKQQRYDSALKRIEEMAARSPRKETWLARRGEILVSAGRPAEARAAFAQALEAIERLPSSRRQVPAMLELGKRLREALEAVDRETKKTG